MTSTRPIALDECAPDQIRSDPRPACHICGALGVPLHKNLEDRLFGAQGTWNLTRCLNPACGLVWLNPMPRQEDIGKAYSRYYTHSDDTGGTVRGGSTERFIRALKACYLASKYRYPGRGKGLYNKSWGLLAYLVPFRRAELDFAVMYLPAVPGGRLLEIGCGNGSMQKGMSNLGWRVEGIDFDPAAAENCRRKGLNVHLGTLEELRYPEDHFDAITMSHLIEHVHDPAGLLRECRRILKPNGRLSLVTPNMNSLGHKVYGSSWLHLDPPRHLHIFSAKALKNMLQRAGFRWIGISSTIRDASAVFAANRSIRRTGVYKMGAPPSRTTSAWSQLMQTLEWGLLKLGFDVGEELAVMAQKADPI
jgi:2-polyprenyl-3-methyl-5-hydroxy-6-metoxy-1,4-benzoquinol methylase